MTRIVVAGAGIGGTATALALLRAGIEVVVLEQARELREIGAGLQISANAVKALRHWGIEDQVASVAVAAESIIYRDLDTGAGLFHTPLGAAVARRYGGAMYQVHRADLLDILVRAVGPGVVRLNAGVAGFAQDGTGVTVTLADGSSLRADALIGADGLKSIVRERLFEPEAPRFTGMLGWRAMVDRPTGERLGFGHSCYAYLGHGRSAVLYWLRGGAILNVIGFVPADEVQRESWTESGDVAAFRRSFAGVAPEIVDLVGTVDRAFITGVYERDPLPRWSDGRVTLLGDAAHALQPYLAQGACQAIEDAMVLSARLAAQGPGGIVAALQDYEAQRRPRTTKVQVVARAAQQFWHERDPQMIAARNGRFRGISRIDPLTETVWSWLYDYDPVTAAYGGPARGLGIATARDGFALRRPAAQAVFALWRDALTPADYAGGWRGLRAGYARFLAANCPPPAGTTAAAVTAGDVPCLWVDPPGGDRGGPIVVYLHGGGFILGSAAAGTDMAARLARAVGGRALAVDYRLAPIHAYPAALDDAVAAFRWALDHGRPVVLAGESAGGGLAAATALRARAEGLGDPLCVYAVSPFADLALGSASIDAREGTDPAVGRDLLTDMSGSYLQGHDPADPFASPVHGDFTGSAPLLIHAAAEEALADDARRLADRARACGAPVTLEIFEDNVHAFTLFAASPDTDAALARFGAFAAGASAGMSAG